MFNRSLFLLALMIAVDPLLALFTSLVLGSLTPLCFTSFAGVYADLVRKVEMLIENVLK